MSVTADKTAGTAASVDRGASFLLWSTVTNTTSSNDARATSNATIGGGGTETSDYLRLTNFGLSSSDIPDGSVINGIEVIIERSSLSPGVTDDTIILRKTSGQVGTNKAVGGSWPATDTNATYGGASDLWGTTWAISDLTSTDFGIDVAVDFSGSESESITARIDYLRLRIYYTTPAVLTASTGSYAITGTTASLKIGRRITATAGSHLITGTTAALIHGIPLVATAGSFAITGTAATLLAGREVSADSGVYVIAGADANLVHFGSGDFGMAALNGAVLITGTGASFRVGYRFFDLTPGAWAITGTDAEFHQNRVIQAQTGVVSILAPSAPDLIRLAHLDAFPPEFLIQGTDVTLRLTTAPTGIEPFMIVFVKPTWRLDVSVAVT